MGSIAESIARRIAELEEELARLRAAQSALVTGTASAPKRRRAPSSRAQRNGAPRAARGTRIKQARDYLALHPKAGASEIAEALGVSRQQAQQLRKRVKG